MTTFYERHPWARILFFFLVCAAFGALSATSAGAAKAGDKIPALSGTTVSGKTATVEAERGKVLVVNIWATWCLPCREELPHFDNLAGMFGDKVEVWAVNVDDSRSAVERYLNKAGFRNLTVLIDADKKIPKALATTAMPSTYVVDQEGTIRYVNEGYKPGDEDKIKEKIEALLK
ncbi:MAG: TlpA family protein disulfide reductase [Deltaproteobacteria bacterium]|nr:TlpA family protein disulfide reductase [bacterium]MCB9475384.1 TlpA family protein disulfide reductase [Deltaproteobacteria bacterium]MCB9478460.1 TlpA family protein disulfide reductase [Deltaproteobacteria bacterium]MCB9489959.1 TlpA family protein disulfide reductase [Deltaproteobacteria bacterium]